MTILVRLSGEFAAPKDGQCGMGSAEQRSVFVKNHGDGNVGEQRSELAFVSEGPTERAFLQKRQDFYGNAAGEIDSAVGEDAQREIAGLRAKSGRPKIES